MAEKGGYKHFMLKEIFEQPRAVRDTTLGRVSRETGQVLLDEMEITPQEFAAFDHIRIVACGTSWHAGLAGKFMIERLARIPVEVDYGSEFRYRDPIITENTLTVVITQSGETADTLAAQRESRSKGSKSIAICNVIGSMATREAEGTIYTHAGPEIGVASTKTFTGSQVDQYLLGCTLGQLRGTLSGGRLRAAVEALARLPDLAGRLMDRAAEVQELAGHFYPYTDFLFLGRGINFPIALEGALKLKEVSYIHAEGYPAGEMKHGPIALIDENMPVVCLALKDHVYDKMISQIEQVKARGGTVVALATEGDESIRRKADHVLYVPACEPLLSPVLASLPLQMLAYYIAVRRGCDVDQPRNLAKSVTVE
jgi:glucosamine--fructose-6-phosphate aminotransferase (isomerizing)